MKIKIMISIICVVFVSNLLGMNITSESDNQNNIISKISKRYQVEVESAILKAGENKNEIIKFLQNIDKEKMESASFLIANMPERDLKQLTSEYLIDNMKYSYLAMEKINWEISLDLFNNYILPYANINERRDNWRQDFQEKFIPLVKDAKTPGDAAMILNEKIWDMVNVHYNTKRPKADQSPYESIDASMASCTGLSILLVDACRSVGIPARFVGIPKWVHVQGNHSWVEIWDNGWHFIGAGEPGPLNKTWFADRAKDAIPDDPKHSIYAVSYENTDVNFPLVFRKGVDYVKAINITRNYLDENTENSVVFSVRVFKGDKRIALQIELIENGKSIAKGISPNETRDLNDMLDFKVEKGKTYTLAINNNGNILKKEILINEDKKQSIDVKL